MAEYVGGKPVVVEKGDKLDMTLPKPIVTVKFDAYSVGTYIVEVNENGNWTSTFYIGSDITEKEDFSTMDYKSTNVIADGVIAGDLYMHKEED